MSKNIAISDEVYRRLKQEKDDQSFSEVIAARLDSGGQVADVTRQEFFGPDTFEEVSEETERLSDGTVRRSEYTTP